MFPGVNFAAALTLGLLIGLERERQKGEGALRKSAGIRTFGLTSLLGAMAWHLGGAWLLGIVVAAMCILCAVSYLRSDSGDPGITTETALIATPLLGAIAMLDVAIASALGVAVAAVLAAKMPLHKFARGVLTNAEINDSLTFAVMTLVIWPQLPDTYLGPWNAVNPHTIWLFVILVLGTSACGRAASRIFGSHIGMPISGLISGFVSSTATIGSMAAQANAQPGLLLPAVAEASLSTIATFLQMGLLLYATSRQTFLTMLPALAAGCGMAALYGGIFLLRSLRSSAPDPMPNKSAFSLKAALLLAGTVSAILILVGALQEYLGTTGILVGAALSGLIDAHAASTSIASLVEAGRLTAHDAAIPILIALTTNACAKFAVTISVGTKSFAMYLLPGLVLSLATAWTLAGLSHAGGVLVLSEHKLW